MKKFKQMDLSFGGKLFYAKNRISKTTKIEIYFPSGARCDTIPGLAHFTEHLFFSGTEKFTKAEINKQYKHFITTNAYTSQMAVAFVGDVFTNELKDYVKMVSMLIRETTFKQDALKKEMPIVQQEIALYKDKYWEQAGAINNFNLTGIKGYENGITILGTKESVASIKSEDVKEFVKKYFIANNLNVFVCSPLSAKKVKKIIEEELVKQLPINNEFEKLPLFYRYTSNSVFYKATYKDIGKSYYISNFHTDKHFYDLKFRATLDVMLKLVNDTAEGVMKKLREEKSLIYGGGFGVSLSNEKEYVISFDTECDKENVNKISEALAEYIKEINENGFSEELFKKTSRIRKYKQENREPRTNAKMNVLNDFYMYGKLIGKQMNKLNKLVTLEDCNKLFREIFVNTPTSLTTYGNIKQEELMDENEFLNLFKFNDNK